MPEGNVMSLIRIEDRNVGFELDLDTDRAFVGLLDLQSGHRWPKVPLAILEIYDRAQQRVDAVSQFDILQADKLAGCVKVSLGSKASGIKLTLELRLDAGEFSVRMNPSELVEKNELYRLFSVDLLPAMMLSNQTGQLLLPVNTGVICEPASVPACVDRFLIYGEQSRWELLPTLPVCAVQTPKGGLTAIAVLSPAETECRINTDGRGNGSVGLGFFFRGKEIDLIEPAVREIRYVPIPAGTDMTVFTAGRLRRHVMEDLGKPTLRQRAAESREVEHLLGAYIMKLFFGMKRPGQTLPRQIVASDSIDLLVTMTFEEAGAALKSFHDAGVDKIYTQNVGWNVLGHDGAYPTRFPVEPRLGGEQSFRKFIAYGHELGYQMTVHDNYIDAYAASEDFDPEVIAVDAFGQMQMRGFWAGWASYLQWPLAFREQHLEDELMKVKSLGIRGPYYMDGMGSPLYQNYHPKHRGTRSDLARGIDKLLKAGRKLFNSAATESGFLYCSITPDLVANPGGDELLKQCKPHWPITPLMKRCVPLWQLTMSGLVVTENQGLTWAETMRALLYAQHPRYEWSTRPGIQPVLDKAMIRKIKYRYDLLIKRFGHLRLLQMTGYQRVDDLETTTFEDGTIISANFATGELKVNGERIDQPAIFQPQ
jgi:hypothetical protein